MASTTTDLKSRWLNGPRKVEWNLILGTSGRTNPLISGTFTTSLSFIDDQGYKWGDTYVMYVGQHYDDYSYWDEVSTLLPIGGGNFSIPQFVPSSFAHRKYKSAAPGVTGLIGEVLATIFYQKVMRVAPYDMAHMLGNRKAPDLCVNLSPQTLYQFILSHKDNDYIRQKIYGLNQAVWNNPLPVECKSRRGKGDRQMRSAVQQLVAYWREVPDMAGYGMVIQTDVTPQTTLNIHLFAPRQLEAKQVRKSIQNYNLLNSDFTLKEFRDLIGVSLIG